MIQFTIPGQPQGKGRPRIGKIGAHARMFTPAKTVAYEGLVAHAAMAAMAGRPRVENAVRARITAWCEVPASWSQKKQARALGGEIRPTTKPDLDNIVKAVFDGLNGVAFRDDVQVVELITVKRYGANPCVVVMLEEFGADIPVPLAQPSLIAEAA